MDQPITKLTTLATLIGVAAFAQSTTAFAVPLQGLLSVDPGILDSVVTASGYTVSKYAGGSYFHMNNPLSIGSTPTAGAMLKPGTDQGVLLGQYQNFVLDPDVPHPQGWQGDLNGDGVPDGAAGTGYSTTPTTAANMLLPFGFFGTNTYVGTNPIAYQSGESHPAPAADLDLSSCDTNNVCNFTLDTSAWEVMWNGSAFEQGPRPSSKGPFVLATGTYNLDTQFYSITWDSQIKQGPFNSIHGFWHLEGTHIVPVPAAAWLLGSGLLGLIGVARRKQ